MQTTIKKSAGITVVGAMVAQTLMAQAWRVERKRDAITDDEIVEAVVKNAGGAELTVLREKNRIVASLELPPLGDVLENDQFFFRVDSLPPHKITADRHRGKWAVVTLSDYDPRMVEGLGREIMDGAELVVRCFTLGGYEVDLRFKLTGARAAIAEATGVPASVTAEMKLAAIMERLSRAAALQDAIDALQRCAAVQGYERDLCRLAFAKCEDEHKGSSHDIRSECFKAVTATNRFTASGE